MSESEEPKIIVDEDWKSKVEREREELAAKAEEAPAEQAPADDAAVPGDAATGSGDAGSQPLPPPTLTLLVTTLLTQALVAMGQMPPAEGATPEVNLPYAKHFIDLVGVIEEKSKGNLTDEETTFIGDSLHQMRMLYVSIKQKSGE